MLKRKSYALKWMFRMSILIIALFLFQNCTVYRGSSVDINNAIQEETKAVVVTKDAEKLKFKRLLKTEENLIGVAKKRQTIKYLEKNGFDFKKHGQLRNYIIDSLEINEIYPKNKPVSTIVNIGISVLSALTVLAVAGGIIFFSSWGG